MKKFLCILLTFVILIGCCACGSGSDDVRGDIVPGNDGTVSQTPSTNLEASVPEFSMGKSEKGVYKNDFLGLTCTVPAGWQFYTDQQILEMNNITAEYYDEDVAQQIQNATVIYDMYAVNGGDGSNINVNLEKVNPLQMLTIDLKQVLEAQIDTIKTTYENMGYTDVNVLYEKVKVDGKDLDALKCAANIQGVDVYVVCFAFTKGNYIANVSVTSALTDKSEDLLGYFTIA